MLAALGSVTESKHHILYYINSCEVNNIKTLYDVSQDLVTYSKCEILKPKGTGVTAQLFYMCCSLGGNLE